VSPRSLHRSMLNYKIYLSMEGQPETELLCTANSTGLLFSDLVAHLNSSGRGYWDAWMILEGIFSIGKSPLNPRSFWPV
jgi:hypothetical protein